MTSDELAAIRERPEDPRGDWYEMYALTVEKRALLAHIEEMERLIGLRQLRIEAAVRSMPNADGFPDRVGPVSRAALLAILRGEQ